MAQEAESSGPTATGNTFVAGGGGPSLPAVTVPSGGGTIRGMLEAYDVDLISGSVSMSIPLPITSIPRWGTPNLALKYDSGGGNGPFGLGWSLMGVYPISRKINLGVPTYIDDQDTFVLNGEDLVPEFKKDPNGEFIRAVSGEYLYAERKTPEYRIRRFRPRVDRQLLRIEQWAKLGDPSDVHWKVMDGHGVTQVFRRDKTCGLFSADKTFGWDLCEAYDSYGGAQLFEYKRENSAGIDFSTSCERNRMRDTQRYIKRIRYGNMDPNRLGKDWSLVTPAGSLPQATWLFDLVFDYGEHDPSNPVSDDIQPTSWDVRQDAFSIYRWGFEVRTYRLCKRILMFHHFPDESLGRDCLVKALQLDYLQSPAITFLQSAIATGYKRKKKEDAYICKALPPLEISYSSAPSVSNLQSLALQPIDEESMQHVSTGMIGSAQWVDLCGDGTTGILFDGPDAWYYKRNLSTVNQTPGDPPTAVDNLEVKFSSLEIVSDRPNLASSRDKSLSTSFMDLDGDGIVDFMVTGSNIAGFYRGNSLPSKASEVWQEFSQFEDWPNANIKDPNLRFIDLNGDGLADILITQDDELVWYPALGSRGFGSGIQIHLKLDEESGPRVMFSDPVESIHLADMTGDGLVDIVRIRCGDICYWPNIGYGNFGGKVTMDNAPVIDYSDNFNQKSILMGDIDGSGTTDMIYLRPNGVSIYYNLAGNGWSSEVPLPNLIPRSNSQTSVTAVDLFGTGTMCLVWSSLEMSLEGIPTRSLQYVDLMSAIKPHLLTGYTNNLGAEVEFTYKPSSSYYLLDQNESQSWVTKLPFPVHCVDKAVQRDLISGTSRQQVYRYHHGYYDPVEREFRGFGAVESWDSEDFISLRNTSTGTGSTTAPAWSLLPPIHTKTWFHTGAFFDVNRLHQLFAPQFFGGRDDVAATQTSQDHFEGRFSPEAPLEDEARQSCRALKGCKIHEELYSDDTTELKTIPFTIFESGNTVRMIQPAGQSKYAVFQVFTHEELDLKCERNISDAALTQSLVLAMDIYGNVTKSANIAYGRNSSKGLDLKPADQQQQRLRRITYIESTPTNCINSEIDYILPRVYASSTYELTGFVLSRSSQNRYQSSDFTGTLGDFSPLMAPSMHEIQYYDEPNLAIPQRRLLSRSETLYRRNDLTGFLTPGQIDTLMLPGQAYTLCQTASITSQYERDKKQLPLSLSNWNAAGYVSYSGDGHWNPSSTSFFSLKDTGSAEELKQAQENFFLPRRAVDPFQSYTTVDYDKYNLLPVSSEDILGNINTATNDYRILQPSLVTDENGNRAQSVWDAFGVKVGAAIMGKETQTLGDSLDGFDEDISDNLLEAYTADPLSVGTQLLGNATSRYIYSLKPCLKQGTPSPNFISTISSDSHSTTALPAQKSRRIQINFVYSDAKSRKVQTKSQAEDGKGWRTSGWMIFNNKDLPIQQFEPFFDSSHHFQSDVKVGVSSVMLYDSLSRPVATLYPDHTWTKTSYTTWSMETWDQNDLVAADPSMDTDLDMVVQKLAPSMFKPSWFDNQQNAKELTMQKAAAADKAAAHQNTPTISYLDSMGNIFLVIQDAGDVKTHDFIEHRAYHDIEGRMTENFDGLGRLATKSYYDMCGRVIRFQDIDTGSRWVFFDVAGNNVLSWDDRKQQFETSYDPLRRPISLHLSSVDTTDPPKMIQKIEYGESLDPGRARAGNLRGKCTLICDQAGVKSFLEHDFRGNLLSSSFQLAANYKDIIDWSAKDVPLEKEVHATVSSFDAFDRPTVIQSPDGSVLGYTYNEAGLLQSIQYKIDAKNVPSPWLTQISDIVYDAFGRQISSTAGNRTVISKTYDPLNHQLVRQVASRNGTVYQDLNYVHDAVGNIVFAINNAAKTIYFRNCLVDAVAEYTLDSTYRLIAATGREHLGQTHGQPYSASLTSTSRAADSTGGLAAADGTVVAAYTETYAYDKAGNMLSLSHGISDSQSPGWKRQFTYTEASSFNSSEFGNKLSSSTVGKTQENYTYDGHGNMTSLPNVKSMTWDFRDRLRTTTSQKVANGVPETVYYVYDSSGSRVRKVVEQAQPDLKNTATIPIMSEHITIDGFDSLQKYDASSILTLQCLTMHIPSAEAGNSTLVEQWSGPQKDAKKLPSMLTRFIFSDITESVTFELDDAGILLTLEEYSPFGSTTYRAALPQAPKRYRFA
ncbi:virulence plasmid 65kDa B protein-domain-containing protein, partial [Leptodontidium sp. 2 PMI_412]